MLTSVLLLLLEVLLTPRLYHHLEAEILSVGSAKGMVTFLLNVETREFYLSMNKVNGNLRVNMKIVEHRVIMRMKMMRRVLVIFTPTWEIALFPVVCLVSMQLEKRKGSDIIFFTPVAPSRTRFAELLLTMAVATTLQVQIW
jgi:hypothetical protein